jgi:hypothetical protein
VSFVRWDGCIALSDADMAEVWRMTRDRILIESSLEQDPVSSIS